MPARKTLVFPQGAGPTTVILAPIITSTSPLPNAAINAPYTFTFTAIQGTPPYTWSSTSLGAFSLNSSTGVMTGTPSNAGTFNFWVEVTDSNGYGTGFLPFQITVAAANNPTITSSSPLPNATVNIAYSFTFTASGGTPPYTWTSSGTGAFTLNATTGVLTGTPTSTGTFNFTVTVTDSLNATSGPVSFQITVQVAGSAFQFYISATGDDANAGTLASPWSITALGTPLNYQTAANKWTTYGGKSVGIIAGNYTQGTFNGVNTALSAITLQGPWPVLIVNGGTSGSPTIIQACDVNGNPVSQTAAPVVTIDYGIDGVATQSQSTGIGNMYFGLIQPPSIGNITINGLRLQNFGYSGITLGTNGQTCPNAIVQNCELHGGAGFHNTNPNAIWLNTTVNGQILNNWIHDCYTPDNCWDCWFTATFSGTTMTVVAMQLPNGQAFATPALNAFTPPPFIYGPASAGLPTGLTIVSQTGGTTGGAGTYTVSATCPTISTPINCNAGWMAATSGGVSTPGFIYGTYTIYGTNNAANTVTITNLTIQDMGVAMGKASAQAANISYSMFELAAFGNPGSNQPPGPEAVLFTPPAGSSVTHHHNIQVGGFQCYDVGQGGSPDSNLGSVTAYNNTFYLPANFNAGHTQGTLLQCTNGTGGTLDWYNNLLWSDIGSYANYGGTILGSVSITTPSSPNGGVTANNNAVQSTFTFNNNSGGPKDLLAAWQTATGLESGSQAMTVSPFASAPQSGNPTTFSLNNTAGGGAVAKVAGVSGAICGAIDGSVSALGYPVGCTFASDQTLFTSAFSFPSGFASAGGTLTPNTNMSLVGSNYQISGNHDAGCVWSNNQYNISGGFMAVFKFQFSSGLHAGDAMGLTFCIQNSNTTTNNASTNGVGVNICGDANVLAYGALWNPTSGYTPNNYQNPVGNSFAITYDNGAGDTGNFSFPSGGFPNASQLVFVGGPSCSQTPNNDLNPYGVNMFTGHVMQATIVYDPYLATITSVLQDTVTGAQSRNTWTNFNPTTVLGGNSGWVGITFGQANLSVANTFNITAFQFWTGGKTGSFPRLVAPTISLASGQYTTSQSVTITAPQGSIYYTTNGLLPTSASTLYSGPITISSNTQLQAIAILANSTDSLVTSASYQIAAAATPIINFGSGFTGAGSQIIRVGSTIANGANIELTDAVNQFEVGCLWYALPVNIQTFSSTFTLLWSGNGFNGITFCIQNPTTAANIVANNKLPTVNDGAVRWMSGGPTAMGNSFNGLGYSGQTGGGSNGSQLSGIGQSVCIKFDMVSGGKNDTGAYTNGADLSTGGTTITGVTLGNTNPKLVTVTYDGTHLAWTIKDTVTSAVYTATPVALNIPNIVGGNTAYVGFTAGGWFSPQVTQQVTNWVFTQG